VHIYMVLLCNMGCYINRQFAHFQLSKILKLYVIQELFLFNECKMVPPLSCKFSICYRIILDCFSRFKYLYLQMKFVFLSITVATLCTILPVIREITRMKKV